MNDDLVAITLNSQNMLPSITFIGRLMHLIV